MFSQACLFTCLRGRGVHDGDRSFGSMSPDIRSGTYPLRDINSGDLCPPPDIKPGSYPLTPASDIWVVITGDLFKLVHLRAYPQMTSIGWQLKLKQIRFLVEHTLSNSPKHFHTHTEISIYQISSHQKLRHEAKAEQTCEK